MNREQFAILTNAFILISLDFFEWKFVRTDNMKYIEFMFMALVIVLSIPGLFKVKGGFSFPLKLLLFAMAVSIPVNFFTWGQPVSDSIFALLPFTAWAFFFVMATNQLSPLTLEKWIIRFGIAYVILYFFQFLNRGEVYFGYLERIGVTRGVNRILFPGSGVFYLSVFIALTKLHAREKGRWLWILFLVLGLLVPTLQVLRQAIAAVALIYFLHFFRQYKWYFKMAVIGAAFGGYFLVLNFQTAITRGLAADTERDMKQGADYIRVQSGTYFLKELPKSDLNRVLGNGAPRYNSTYGLLLKRLETFQQYSLSDVGLIAVYFMFGIFAVIAFLLIWLKSVMLKLPARFYYAKYYLWFLFFTSLTSYNIYDHNFLVANVFSVYIFHVISQASQGSRLVLVQTEVTGEQEKRQNISLPGS